MNTEISTDTGVYQVKQTFPTVLRYLKVSLEQNKPAVFDGPAGRVGLVPPFNVYAVVELKGNGEDPVPALDENPFD